VLTDDQPMFTGPIRANRGKIWEHGENMSQLSKETLKEILWYIQKFKVTPKSIPGCDEEELHEHFTCLVNEGFVVGENVIRTGVGEVVRDVMIPKLTPEGRQFLGDLKMP
jgi:hypothetical protein